MKKHFFKQIISDDRDWVSCKWCKLSMNIGKCQEYWCPKCRNKLRGPRGDIEVGKGSIFNMVKR